MTSSNVSAAALLTAGADAGDLGIVVARIVTVAGEVFATSTIVASPSVLLVPPGREVEAVDWSAEGSDAAWVWRPGLSGSGGDPSLSPRKIVTSNREMAAKAWRQDLGSRGKLGISTCLDRLWKVSHRHG